MFLWQCLGNYYLVLTFKNISWSNDWAKIALIAAILAFNKFCQVNLCEYETDKSKIINIIADKKRIHNSLS